MTQNDNPYIGPRPFERKKEDLDRFFGRSHETEEIVSLIFGHPVTLIYAQSGAGKTSLFNASIAPNLEQNGFEVLPLTRVGEILSKEDIKEVKNFYIFNALLKMDLETDPLSLASKSLSEFLKPRARKKDENDQPCPRAIIFDQFEELFTYIPVDWRRQRKEFFDQITKAVEDDPLLRVVFVIREDYLAELDPYARELPERLRIRYRLERLGENAALRAVKDPLTGTFRRFAPGVAEGLVKQLLTIRTVDAAGKMTEIEGQYVEPVQLQVVCVTLWSSLESEIVEIQHSHLESFNVSDALSNFYKNAIDSAVKETGVDEADLRKWFGKTLVTPMGTRNTVFRGEVSTGGIDNKVVDFLVGRHIIRAEYRAGARWYELTHDSLVESIITDNEKWFAANLSLFQQQAALWVANGRPEGMLLRGTELDKAMDEAKAESKTISKDERDFLTACQRERGREQREKRSNFLNRILAVSASLAFIVTILSLISSNRTSRVSSSIQATASIVAASATAGEGESQEAKATQQARATGEVIAKNLAKEAREALGNPRNWSLGRLLAVESYNKNLGLGENIFPSVYQALFDSAGKGNEVPLKPGSFSSADFSTIPNGDWLVVDNVLWNLDNFQDYPLIETGQVVQSAFRENGDIVLVVYTTSIFGQGQSPYTIYIKDTKNQLVDQIPIKMPEPESAYVVKDISLSDDGNWFSIGYDRKQNIDLSDTLQTGILQVWDIKNPVSEPIRLSIQETPNIVGVTMSSDGKLLAVVDAKKQVYIWINGDENDDTFSFWGTPTMVIDGYLPDYYIDGVFQGKSGNGLQFSPDGRWLAVLTKNRINIYSTNNKLKLQNSFVIPTERIVMGFLFSADSSRLVFIVNDYRVCADFYFFYISNYEVLTYDRFYKFSGSYNCDPDSSVFYWRFAESNNSPRSLAGNNYAEITAMNYSEAGKLIVGDISGYVHDWDLVGDLVTDTQPLRDLNVHNGQVTNIMVRADNKFIISAGVDFWDPRDSTRLWNIQDNETGVLRIPTFNTASIVIKANGNDEDVLIIGGSDTRDGKGIVEIFSNFQVAESMKPGNDSSDDGKGTIDTVDVNEKWIVAGRYNQLSLQPYFLDIWDRTLENSNISLTTIHSDSRVTGLSLTKDGASLSILTYDNEVFLTTIDDLLSKFYETVNGSTPTATSATGNLESKTALVSLQKVTEKDKLNVDMAGIRFISFMLNDEYLLVAGTTGVWSIAIDNSRTIVLPRAVYPVAISADQRWLATDSNDGTGVHLYDLTSPGGILSSPIILDVKDPVTQFSFNTDSDHLVVAVNTETVYIYDLTSSNIRQEYVKLFGSGASTQFDFSKEGNLLVASGGPYVYLWDLENPKDDPVVLTGHTGNVMYAGFTQKGDQIATIAKDQTLRFWPMDPGELARTACAYAGRNLSSEEINEYLLSGSEKTCEEYPEQNVSSEPTPTPAPYPTANFYQTLTPISTSTPVPLGSFIEYRVKEGDYLSTVADYFNIELAILIQDNIDSIKDKNTIYPGQILKIRINSTPTPITTP